MLTELFGAINTIASLVPEFSEEKKELLQKETEVYSKLERILNKIMLEFKIGSNTDEMFAISEELNYQAKKLKNLYVIYAQEIKGIKSGK